LNGQLARKGSEEVAIKWKQFRAGGNCVLGIREHKMDLTFGTCTEHKLIHILCVFCASMSDFKNSEDAEIEISPHARKLMSRESSLK
jgi:hypothetical protein